jgi:hypothetical protein
MTIDIIPDIHGQHDTLLAALKGLGWRRSATGWTHPEPDRQILFLGDLIDRGPENAAVIRTVRSLVDDDRAEVILGNHELNAMQFHTRHPETGAPLRRNDEKNIRQHRAFLDEFPPGAKETCEVMAWLQTVPLLIETDRFRAVHAAWAEPTVAALRGHLPDLRLDEAALLRSADKADPLYRLVEEVAKGPETSLPEGVSFLDKDGTERTEVRLRWWRGGAFSWREVAMSVPDPDVLPYGPLPDHVRSHTYPQTARPVFFGHYWLTGAPQLQAPNALCLDYSAGKGGPLVTYAYEPGETALSLSRVRVHPAV